LAKADFASVVVLLATKETGEDEQIIGVAAYVLIDGSPRRAEVATKPTPAGITESAPHCSNIFRALGYSGGIQGSPAAILLNYTP